MAKSRTKRQQILPVQPLSLIAKSDAVTALVQFDPKHPRCEPNQVIPQIPICAGGTRKGLPYRAPDVLVLAPCIDL